MPLRALVLVFNPIMVNNYASLFNCKLVGWASDSMMAALKAIHFGWGHNFFFLLLGPPGFNFASDFQWCCLTS